jgi:subtilisin family serine protease
MRFQRSLAVVAAATLLVTGLSLSASANPGRAPAVPGNSGGGAGVTAPGNSGANAALPAATNRPTPAPAVEIPASGQNAVEEIVREVGKPDLSNPSASAPGQVGTTPGNSGAAPGQGSTVPGAPVTLPGNSGNAPGQGGTAPGNSGNAPGQVGNPGNRQGELSPPGLTRRLDTPAAAALKLKNGEEGCEAAISGAVTNDACATQTYMVLYQRGADMAVEKRGLGNRLQRSFDGLVPGVAVQLTAAELAELAQFSTVLAIEPDSKFEIPKPVQVSGFSVSATQTNAVWGLDRIDQAGLPLNGSYTYDSDGSGVRAYVVDTGVLTSHNQFSSRVAPGFTAIADGRGVTDCNGHGTHVAGTIAGSTHGVAKGATIVPVRVLDCAGSGTLSGVVAGLNWIAETATPGEPAVVNMSLGGGASPTLDAAVQSLIDKGMTVVVAAGNSTADACQFSPARVPGAITVAASAQNDSFASFSNFGSCVDVVAPGVGITSTWISSNTSTNTISGTSMASPHVAGIVAQQLALGYQNPTNTNLQVTSTAVSGVITATPAGTANLLVQAFVPASEPDAPVTEPTPEPTPEQPATEDPAADEPATTTPGGGNKAEPREKTKPVAPGKVRARLVNGKAEIEWQLPPDGGAPIVRQLVHLYVFGEEIARFEVAPDVNVLPIEGLEPGVGYVATVSAVNALGESPESMQSNVIRPVPPQGPSDGVFQAWVKRVSETEAKIYVKYPQLGQKVQLEFQNQATGERYRERGWVRVQARDLNEQGHYTGLQNEIYFVRTVTLEPGKNRLRIMVDGAQVGRTVTYSR